MRVGISLTSNYPDVKDPRQGARWMVERAAAAHRAALDSLFVGNQHVSPTAYYQNTPILGRHRERIIVFIEMGVLALVIEARDHAHAAAR